MAELDTVTTASILALTVLMVATAIIEIKFLRARRSRRSQGDQMADQAHNSLLTAKVIASTLSKEGVSSSQAQALMDEAELSMSRGNYRVAMELSEKARSLLREAKAEREKEGDIAKLEALKGGDEVTTTKETLQKELPENYLQAKFSISLARDSIDSCKRQGSDVTEAEKLLRSAEQSFESKDYTSALKYALLSKKSLEGAKQEAPSPQEVTHGEPVCPSCGAAMDEDDNYCPKCGARIDGIVECQECGTQLAEGDLFCRKCGVKLVAQP